MVRLALCWAWRPPVVRVSVRQLVSGQQVSKSASRRFSWLARRGAWVWMLACARGKAKHPNPNRAGASVGRGVGARAKKYFSVMREVRGAPELSSASRERLSGISTASRAWVVWRGKVAGRRRAGPSAALDKREVFAVKVSGSMLLRGRGGVKLNGGMGGVNGQRPIAASVL